jgi:inositol 3-alpha-galactosyltransferase
MFPDRDFLTEFFKGRWISVGWQYNALKTMHY